MTFWNTVKDFVDKFSDAGGETVELGEEQVRLATAALLVHAMCVDGKVDDREKKVLRDSLEKMFHLDDEQANDLIVQATKKEEDGIDWHSFTNELQRKLDHNSRVEVVGMLWQVIDADGVIDEAEGSLAWRAGESLGLSPNDWVELRKRTENRSG